MTDTKFIAPSPAYLAALAMPELRRLKKAAVSWAEECEEYARQGFRPHYCQHGTNQWTDYDNICGGCEDGIDFTDPLTMRRMALDDARVRYAQVTERLAWLGNCPDGLPDSVRGAIVNWSCEPIR